MFQAGVKGGRAFSGKGVGAAGTLMRGVFRSRGQAPVGPPNVSAETDAFAAREEAGAAEEKCLPADLRRFLQRRK